MQYSENPTNEVPWWENWVKATQDIYNQYAPVPTQDIVQTWYNTPPEQGGPVWQEPQYPQPQEPDVAYANQLAAWEQQNAAIEQQNAQAQQQWQQQNTAAEMNWQAEVARQQAAWDAQEQARVAQATQAAQDIRAVQAQPWYQQWAQQERTTTAPNLPVQPYGEAYGYQEPLVAPSAMQVAPTNQAPPDQAPLFPPNQPPPPYGEGYGYQVPLTPQQNIQAQLRAEPQAQQELPGVLPTALTDYNKLTPAQVEARLAANPELIAAHQVYTPINNPFPAGSRENQAVSIYSMEVKQRDDALKRTTGHGLSAIAQLALWESVQTERGTGLENANPPMTNVMGWDKNRAPDTAVPTSPAQYSGITGKPTSGDLPTLMAEGTVKRASNGVLWFVVGAFASEKAERFPGDIEYIRAKVASGAWTQVWADEYLRLISANSAQSGHMVATGYSGIPTAATRAAQATRPTAKQPVVTQPRAPAPYGYAPAGGYGGYGYPFYSYSSPAETTPASTAEPGWNRLWRRMNI
jgi:hypothetical protein